MNVLILPLRRAERENTLVTGASTVCRRVRAITDDTTCLETCGLAYASTDARTSNGGARNCNSTDNPACLSGIDCCARDRLDVGRRNVSRRKVGRRKVGRCSRERGDGNAEDRS